MKINTELIREILLDIEELHEYPKVLHYSNPTHLRRASTYDNDVIVYHLRLLNEAGLINWNPQFTGDRQLYHSFIDGLTYQGHEFLDSIRSPKIWRETKTTAEKVGVFSLNFLSQTASQIIANIANNPELLSK